MTTLILVGIGLMFAVIFHAGTKEPSDERDKRMATTDVDADAVNVVRH